jgi:hypothetical protein
MAKQMVTGLEIEIEFKDYCIGWENTIFLGNFI